MRFRATGVLVVLLAALAAYVYYAEIKPGDTKAKEADAKLQVFDFEDQNVDKLEVTAGGKTVSLEKKEGAKQHGWQLVNPSAEYTDTTRVGSLLAQVTHIKATKNLGVPKEGLSAYGLEPPEVDVKMHVQGGREEELKVGKKTVDGTGVYVMKAGDNILYLMAPGLADQLSRLVTVPPVATATPTPGPTNTPLPTPPPAVTPSPGTSPTP